MVNSSKHLLGDEEVTHQFQQKEEHPEGKIEPKEDQRGATIEQEGQ